MYCDNSSQLEWARTFSFRYVLVKDFALIWSDPVDLDISK